MFFKKKSAEYHRVHTYGSPILNKKAEPIKVVNAEIRAIAAKMVTTMQRFEGIGLAGPQAGIGLRIVAFGVPEKHDDDDDLSHVLSPGEAMLLPKMPLVVINPEITWRSDETDIKEEGCLSLPGIYGNVERSTVVALAAETLTGEKIACECNGLLARCIQHELDHLDGKLFIDRMSQAEFGAIKAKLTRLKKTGRKKNFVRVLGS